MAQPYTLPLYTFHKNDGSGEPIADGFVGTYITNTTTPKDTYVDSLGVTPAQNPIPLDANGQCQIWFGTGAYKIVVYDNLMNIIYTMDPVSAIDTLDVTTIGNVSDLRDLPPGAADYLFMLGYYTNNDMGGGHIYWDATSTAVDNGYNVFKPNSINVSVAGRWRRVNIGVPNVIMAGAKATQSSLDDNFIPITTILQYEPEFFFPPGGYYISTSIKIDNNKTITGQTGSTIAIRQLPSTASGHITNKRPAFDVRGSNVTIKGIRFTSDSRNNPPEPEEVNPPCGIEINGAYDGTSSNYCANINISNCRFEYMMGGIFSSPGFVASSTTPNLFTGWVIENNYFELISVQNITHPGGNPDLSTAFCMYLQGLDAPVIRNNKIDNSQSGTFSGHKITLVGCPNAVIENNIILDKASLGLTGSQGSATSPMAAIEIIRTEASDCRYTSITDNFIRYGMGINSNSFYSSSIIDNKYEGVDNSAIFVSNGNSYMLAIKSAETTAPNSVISNNIIRYMRPSDLSSPTAIQLESGINNCAIDSNEIAGGTYGIIVTGCENVAVTGNSVLGILSNGYSILSNTNNGSGKLRFGFNQNCPFKEGDLISASGFSGSHPYNVTDAAISNRQLGNIGGIPQVLFDIVSVAFTTTQIPSAVPQASITKVPNPNYPGSGSQYNSIAQYYMTASVTFTSSPNFTCTGNVCRTSIRSLIRYKGTSYGVIDGNTLDGSANGIPSAELTDGILCDEVVDYGSGDVFGTVVSNNRITLCNGWGIRTDNVTFVPLCRYTGNVVKHNNQGGILFTNPARAIEFGSNPIMSHVVIDGNDFSENNGPGIVLSNYHGMTITNNTCRNSSKQFKSSTAQGITVTAVSDATGDLQITTSADHELYDGYIVLLQGFGTAGYNKVSEIRVSTTVNGDMIPTQFICVDIPWTGTSTVGTYRNITAPITLHNSIGNTITGNNLTGEGLLDDDNGPEYSLVLTQDYRNNIISQNIMGHVNPSSLNDSIKTPIFIDTSDALLTTYNQGTYINNNIFFGEGATYPLKVDYTMRSVTFGTTREVPIEGTQAIDYVASRMSIGVGAGGTISQINGGAEGDIISIQANGPTTPLWDVLVLDYNDPANNNPSKNILLENQTSKTLRFNFDNLTLMKVSQFWKEIAHTQISSKVSTQSIVSRAINYAPFVIVTGAAGNNTLDIINGGGQGDTITITNSGVNPPTDDIIVNCGIEGGAGANIEFSPTLSPVTISTGLKYMTFIKRGTQWYLTAFSDNNI